MLDLTGIGVDTSDFLQIAALLISCLVGFWACRKGIELIEGAHSSKDNSVYYNHDGSFEYHSQHKKRWKEFDV